MNNQKIILLRGLQGSGKSTLAREWVNEAPDDRVRINRDDIRFQIAGKYWGLSRIQEESVTRFEFAMARAAIDVGQSVMVDNTNLRARNVKPWLKLGLELSVPVEHIDVPVDLETAIARDAARDRIVGEEVIRDFYARYFKKDQFPPFPELDASELVEAVYGKAYVPDRSLPKAVWVDVDGTLAERVHPGVIGAVRGPFDEHRVGEDAVIEHVRDVVQLLHKDGWKVVIMSGRSDLCQAETEEWLQRHDIPYDDIFMRRAEADKGRKDNVVKHDLFWEFVAPKYDVRFALDDRQQVVDYTRDVLKIPVFQVAEGNF